MLNAHQSNGMIRHIQEHGEVWRDVLLRHVAVIPIPNDFAVLCLSRLRPNFAGNAKVWQMQVLDSARLQVSRQIALAKVGLIHADWVLTHVE